MRKAADIAAKRRKEELKHAKRAEQRRLEEEDAYQERLTQEAVLLACQEAEKEKTRIGVAEALAAEAKGANVAALELAISAAEAVGLVDVAKLTAAKQRLEQLKQLVLETEARTASSAAADAAMAAEKVVPPVAVVGKAPAPEERKPLEEASKTINASPGIATAPIIFINNSHRACAPSTSCSSSAKHAHAARHRSPSPIKNRPAAVVNCAPLTVKRAIVAAVSSASSCKLAQSPTLVARRAEFDVGAGHATVHIPDDPATRAHVHVTLGNSNMSMMRLAWENHPLKITCGAPSAPLAIMIEGSCAQGREMVAGRIWEMVDACRRTCSQEDNALVRWTGRVGELMNTTQPPSMEAKEDGHVMRDAPFELGRGFALYGSSAATATDNVATVIVTTPVSATSSITFSSGGETYSASTVALFPSATEPTAEAAEMEAVLAEAAAATAADAAVKLRREAQALHKLAQKRSTRRLQRNINHCQRALDAAQREADVATQVALHEFMKLSNGSTAGTLQLADGEATTIGTTVVAEVDADGPHANDGEDDQGGANDGAIDEGSASESATDEGSADDDSSRDGSGSIAELLEDLHDAVLWLERASSDLTGLVLSTGHDDHIVAKLKDAFSTIDGYLPLFVKPELLPFDGELPEVPAVMQCAAQHAIESSCETKAGRVTDAPTSSLRPTASPFTPAPWPVLCETYFAKGVCHSRDVADLTERSVNRLVDLTDAQIAYCEESLGMCLGAGWMDRDTLCKATLAMGPFPARLCLSIQGTSTASLNQTQQTIEALFRLAYPFAHCHPPVVYPIWKVWAKGRYCMPEHTAPTEPSRALDHTGLYSELTPLASQPPSQMQRSPSLRRR